MQQLLLQGFPEGSIKIGINVTILEKEGMRTYFVGTDNYFSHPVGDRKSERYALATLIKNSHVRVSEVTRSPLSIPHRTLMNWCRQLDEHGSSSFFKPRNTRSGTVMTPQKVVQCEKLFSYNLSISEVARKADIKESTLRKAISSGRVTRCKISDKILKDNGTTKSERSRLDAKAAEGIGTACTRADERVQAATGVVKSVVGRFEKSLDVHFGGVLTGLPALCYNGLFSGLDKYISLPNGFYSALHILTVLGFMALARIRRPEGLRHIPPWKIRKISSYR